MAERIKADRHSIMALVLMLSLFFITAASPARADWLRAESERFIVYSDGSEGALRDYVQKLEMFDRVMQYQSGISTRTTPPRKLPIYLVRGRRGLLDVHPQSGENVVGTYFPTEEDIFAVAVRQTRDGIGGDDILMHEYVHHFMMNNMPSAYPAWFVEGFAEYYMTAEIDVRAREVLLGNFNQNRAYWIMSESWIPLDVLLQKRPGELRSTSHKSTYYPIAWLMTHWFMSDTGRRAQLQTYLNDVATGSDSVEAMQRATGMDLAQLQRTLRRYTRERLAARKISGQFPTAEITLTRMSPAADDLLLINQRLKVGVPTADRDALGQEVARLASRYPDDPLALMAAGHAGLHFGDRPAGERALQRLLEVDPDHIEALQYLAQESLRQAREGDETAGTAAARVEARAYLARAYAAGENDYRTLMLLAELRQGQPGYPNENDLLTLGLAMDRAPQLAAIRFRYATALALNDDKDEAIAVLRPITKNPHGGDASAFAERMIAALEADEPLPDLTEEAEEPQIVEPEPRLPPEAVPQSPQDAEPAVSDR